jgi:hypothetical protein
MTNSNFRDGTIPLSEMNPGIETALQKPSYYEIIRLL